MNSYGQKTCPKLIMHMKAFFYSLFFWLGALTIHAHFETNYLEEETKRLWWNHKHHSAHATTTYYNKRYCPHLGFLSITPIIRPANGCAHESNEHILPLNSCPKLQNPILWPSSCKVIFKNQEISARVIWSAKFQNHFKCWQSRTKYWVSRMLKSCCLQTDPPPPKKNPKIQILWRHPSWFPKPLKALPGPFGK